MQHRPASDPLLHFFAWTPPPPPRVTSCTPPCSQTPASTCPQHKPTKPHTTHLEAVEQHTDREGPRRCRACRGGGHWHCHSNGQFHWAGVALVPRGANGLHVIVHDVPHIGPLAQDAGCFGAVHAVVASAAAPCAHVLLCATWRGSASGADWRFGVL
jgi:hypothetical protein